MFLPAYVQAHYKSSCRPALVLVAANITFAACRGHVSHSAVPVPALVSVKSHWYVKCGGCRLLRARTPYGFFRGPSSRANHRQPTSQLPTNLLHLHSLPLRQTLFHARFHTNPDIHHTQPTTTPHHIIPQPWLLSALTRNSPTSAGTWNPLCAHAEPLPGRSHASERLRGASAWTCSGATSRYPDV